MAATREKKQNREYTEAEKPNLVNGKKVAWDKSVISPAVQHDIDVHKDILDWMKCIVNGWVDYVPKEMVVNYPGEWGMRITHEGKIGRDVWRAMRYAENILAPELRDLKNDLIVIQVDDERESINVRWKRVPKDMMPPVPMGPTA